MNRSEKDKNSSQVDDQTDNEVTSHIPETSSIEDFKNNADAQNARGGERRPNGCRDENDDPATTERKNDDPSANSKKTMILRGARRKRRPIGAR